MPPAPCRRDLLATYDAFADDLARGGAPTSDLAALRALATRLAADVNGWRDIVDRLDHAVGARLDPSRAATLVLESVFDEVLIPSAWSVLSATLALEHDGAGRNRAVFESCSRVKSAELDSDVDTTSSSSVVQNPAP